MSMRPTDSIYEVPAIRVDAVVIGGGIQGLWLLRDLALRGFRALLLESSSIGAGQTRHSHAFLHRGHFFGSECLFSRLDAAKVLWDGWISSNRNPTLSKAYCVFSTLEARTKYDRRWDSRPQRPPVK